MARSRSFAKPRRRELGLVLEWVLVNLLRQTVYNHRRRLSGRSLGKDSTTVSEPVGTGRSIHETVRLTQNFGSPLPAAGAGKRCSWRRASSDAAAVGVRGGRRVTGRRFGGAGVTRSHSSSTSRRSRVWTSCTTTGPPASSLSRARARRRRVPRLRQRLLARRLPGAVGSARGAIHLELGGNRLYRNRGDGTFEDVTATARVGGRGYGIGVAVADYDDDGWVDLYVTNLGPDVLYRNEGAAPMAWSASPTSPPRPGWATRLLDQRRLLRLRS